LCYRD